MTLGEEVWHVQNPALGALLLWRFAVGYSAARPDAAACPLPVVFLVLPMVLHDATAQRIRGTKLPTGLRGFAAKFATTKAAETDVLLSLHDRAKAMRGQTVDALRTALRARLVGTDVATAGVFALSTSKTKNVAPNVRGLLGDAEKLGAWCAALTPFEIASTLKVRF